MRGRATRSVAVVCQSSQPGSSGCAGPKDGSCREIWCRPTEISGARSHRCPRPGRRVEHCVVAKRRLGVGLGVDARRRDTRRLSAKVGVGRAVSTRAEANSGRGTGVRGGFGARPGAAGGRMSNAQPRVGRGCGFGAWLGFGGVRGFGVWPGVGEGRTLIARPGVGSGRRANVRGGAGAQRGNGGARDAHAKGDVNRGTRAGSGSNRRHEAGAWKRVGRETTSGTRRRIGRPADSAALARTSPGADARPAGRFRRDALMWPQPRRRRSGGNWGVRPPPKGAPKTAPSGTMGRLRRARWNRPATASHAARLVDLRLPVSHQLDK